MEGVPCNDGQCYQINLQYINFEQPSTLGTGSTKIGMVKVLPNSAIFCWMEVVHVFRISLTILLGLIPTPELYYVHQL